MIGVPADTAARMSAAKPTNEVTKTDTGVTVKTTSGDKVFTNSVVFGQDSQTDIGGLKYIVSVHLMEPNYILNTEFSLNYCWIPFRN